MRKGRDGEKNGEKKREENTDENSGHYVIASSRPLERRTLVPIKWKRSVQVIYKYIFPNSAPPPISISIVSMDILL